MDTPNSIPEREIVQSPAGELIILPTVGDLLAAEDDFIDLIGDAAWQGISWVVLPRERIADDFFQLRTGLAGAVAQKFVNYRLGLAILGDISEFTDVSPTLRDLVRESNAGRQLWFVPDRATLDERLARLGSSPRSA